MDKTPLLPRKFDDPTANCQRYANINLSLGLLFLGLYLAMGAVVFEQLEHHNELEDRTDLRFYLKDFLMFHHCVSHRELEDLIEKVVEANHKGVSAVRNVSSDPNWSFGQSFFFSGTLISTVGYGHVSPITQGGKAFTILYALIGIPLTLSLLTALVDRLKIPSIWFLGFLNCRLGHLYQPSQIRVFHLLMLFAVILVILFLIPAVIFISIEPGWSYLDAFYYCFISLTTIGLGDYIPGDQPDQQNRAVYKIFTTVYLLIGLCCMMLLLSTIYDIPQLNLGNFFLVKQDDQSYNDPERLQLANKGLSGPKYTKHLDDQSPTNPSPASSNFSQTQADDTYHQSIYQ